MATILQETIWAQKYRPSTIQDIILPPRIKQIAEKFVADQDFPNLLLSGPAGTGKTTLAYALVNMIEADYITINGSLDSGIDVLRIKIHNFAVNMSLTGAKKYVIIDEADGLNINSTQPALRSFIEQYSANCGFILTCNFPNKLLTQIRSRLSEINFTFDKSENQQLAKQMFVRCKQILTQEQVQYDPAAVAAVIRAQFPDFRQTLIRLQTIAAAGPIDQQSMIASTPKTRVDQLFDAIAAKDFQQIRQWVAENSDQDYAHLFRSIYEVGLVRLDDSTIPAFITMLADYMYKHSFVADPEINLTAFAVELMVEAQFRG